jgi:hypothetical protein
MRVGRDRNATLGQRSRADADVENGSSMDGDRRRDGIQHFLVMWNERANPFVVLSEVNPEMSGDLHTVLRVGPPAGRSPIAPRAN